MELEHVNTLFLFHPVGYTVKIAVACAVAYWHLDLAYLYIGYVIEGLTGSPIALFMAISVYMADNTSKEKSRSYGMIVSQVCFRWNKST